MAAGIITKNVTISSGVTIALDFWVDDTASPTIYKHVSVLVDSSGNPVSATTNALDVNIKALTGAIAALTFGGQQAAPVTNVDAYSQWEWVDVSASAQVMGGSGAANDYLAAVVIIPVTTSPGAVSIADGAGTARAIFLSVAHRAYRISARGRWALASMLPRIGKSPQAPTSKQSVSESSPDVFEAPR